MSRQWKLLSYMSERFKNMRQGVADNQILFDNTTIKLNKRYDVSSLLLLNHTAFKYLNEGRQEPLAEVCCKILINQRYFIPICFYFRFIKIGIEIRSYLFYRRLLPLFLISFQSVAVLSLAVLQPRYPNFQQSIFSTRTEIIFEFPIG